MDGTGGPGVPADVAVARGLIAAVGDLAGSEATQVIDADGLVVCPGFVAPTPITTRNCSGTRWPPHRTCTG